DFNNDTFVDIIVINHGTNSISIFYGDRKGNFVNLFTYSTGYDSFPYALTTGDLNNDNRLDIVIANFGTNDIHLVFFNSSNTIQQSLIISTGVDSQPSSVVVADFNSDGFVDIAVSNY
ncbi:unnamed protein product, partial [Adineta ricciae]